jgi:hypothetical protein
LEKDAGISYHLEDSFEKKGTMKKSTLLILILIMILSAYCSKEKWEGSVYKEAGVTVIESKGPGIWGDKINEKITFKENLSLGVEEGEEFLVFHTELDVVIDPESNIHVLDSRNNRLLKFDKLGNFIWETGRKGQGPGEFRNPSEIALSPSGEIWVLDGSAFIHIFDAKGKYSQTINLKSRCKHFQFLPDGRLLISSTTRGQMGFSAEYYSGEGKLLEEFPEDYRFGPEFPSWVGGSLGGGGYRVLNSKIHMILPDKYEIREYDLNGKLLGKIKRDIKLKPPEVKAFERGFEMRTSNIMGPCFLYKKKMLLNTLMLFERNAQSEVELNVFLDFFNEKEQFLGSYKLPEYTRLKAIDHENHFYFVQGEPYPRIIRSTLEIK